MKVVIMHLQRDKATGIFSYRRRFPKELIRHIPSDSPTGKGRTELKVSLRATSLDDPKAKARLAAAESEYEALVSKAQKLANGTFDPLDAATITFLASQVIRSGLELDHEVRWLSEPSEPRRHRQ